MTYKSIEEFTAEEFIEKFNANFPMLFHYFYKMLDIYNKCEHFDDISDENISFLDNTELLFVKAICSDFSKESAYKTGRLLIANTEVVK